MTAGWLAVLLAFSLTQVSLYRLTAREVAKISFLYVPALCVAFAVAEIAKQWMVDIGLRWWLGLTITFAGYLGGEFISLLLRGWRLVNPVDGNPFWEWRRANPRKLRRRIPSFFAFSFVFAMLSWLRLAPEAPFVDISVFIMVYSVAQVFLLGLCAGIREKLLLADVPKAMEGLPVLFVSVALLLLVLEGIMRRFF